MHVIRVPEEKSEMQKTILKKLMAKNFQNLMRDTNI